MSAIKLPSVPVVKPWGEFRLGDEERDLFDSITVEHVQKIGTPLDYYAFDRSGSITDPLYNEPEKRAFKGPYRVWAYMEYPENAPEIRDEGTRQVWNCSCFIPRKSLEDAGCQVPNEGDVVAIWKTPFFDSWAGGFEQDPLPGIMYAFDCVNVNDDGHLFDNPSFVGYKIELRRRSEFTPERRIDVVTR